MLEDEDLLVRVVGSRVVEDVESRDWHSQVTGVQLHSIVGLEEALGTDAGAELVLSIKELLGLNVTDNVGKDCDEALDFYCGQ